MTDAVVQVAPDSSGKKIDTSELTVGANTVERQRVVTADDGDPAGLAKVQAADPANTDYGLTVRPVNPKQGDTGSTASGPVMQAVVNDTVENYLTGTVQTLSLTPDGRVRVASVQSNTWMNLFDSDLGSNPGSDPAGFCYCAGNNPYGL